MESRNQTFVLAVKLPRLIALQASMLERSEWVEEVNQEIYSEESDLFLGSSSLVTPSGLVEDVAAPPIGREIGKTADQQWVEFYFLHFEVAKRWQEIFCERFEDDVSAKIEVLEGQDWQANWRAHFKPIDIKPCWRVIPVWEKMSAVGSSGRIPIVIKPSFGFGSGTHPTTQMCLEYLGTLKMLTNTRVLDAGCGSGILSVAAAKIGAKVVAVDIDPLALESAKDCVALNEQGENVSFVSSVEEVSTRFDLIIANILFKPLWDLAPLLLERLNRGGQLVLSGLVQRDIDEIQKRYEQIAKQKGFSFSSVDLRSKKDWGLLAFKFSDGTE